MCGMLLSDDELSGLVKEFYEAYRTRFEAVAPADDPPVPLLAQQMLDLAVINGGRALHFFFTAPDEAVVGQERRVTRLHDVSIWPADTAALKRLEERAPAQHREQVRRTADIGDAVYVHFVVWPEDGDLGRILREVAERLAEREVRRAAGEDVGREEPSIVRRKDSPRGAGPEWFRPGP